MDFKDVKQQLLLTRDSLQGKIVIIDEIVKGLDNLHGVADVTAIPTKMGRRGRPRSTKSKDGLLRGHDLSNAANINPLMSDKEIKALKKKEYMKRWRDKKNGYAATPGFNNQNSKKQDPGTKPNKFSLEREFELDDKDLSCVPT